jgi:hypothetical protein
MSDVTTAEARALSVQGPARATIPFSLRAVERRALLPPYGSQAREIALRRLYRHPHNTLVQGAMAGLVSKVVSTPFEVVGPTEAESENAQAMLLNAHFGKGAEHLLSVSALNYLRHDRGVWWELIGYGHPDEALAGAPVAVSALDPIRCFPTGDATHPVWYYSTDGRIHRLHHTRVVHFVDMPDGDEDYPDTGLCALSRAVAIAEREILMGQYISTRLDDKPKPGLMLFKNIEETQYREAAARYLAERRAGRSDQDIFGEVFMLFGVDPHEMAGVEYVSYSEAPEKFDYIAYVQLDVKELALALGVDIQEIWELTGGGIGTGTQSQILHEKSKGKTLGRMRKMFERALNLSVLPPECEFRWQYRDSQEDSERAELAASWSNTVVTLGSDLSQQQRLQLLANQVEAFADVILDARGQVRLPDDDIEPAVPTITEDDENTEDEADAPDGAGFSFKDFDATSATFARAFSTLVNQARDGTLNRRSLGIRLRQQLRLLGEQAYRDGMAEGGAGDEALGSEDRAALQAWLSEQSRYVSHLTEEVVKQGLSDAQVEQRADAWATNSLGEIRLRGLASVKANQYMRWAMNSTAEHCPTCLKLNGQVHRLRDWLRYGFYPKASTLVCWSGCKCALEPAEGPAQGNLRGVRYIRLRKARKERSWWGTTATALTTRAVLLRKGSDGLRYIGLITSNAYADRDGEIVSERALRHWVASVWKGGRYAADNPLLFWHAGEPIGDVIWSDMRGPFLIEIAKERPTPFARRIFDLIARREAAWGVSHGFVDQAHDYDGRWKVYRRIAKKETSVLPLAFAANAFTTVKVKTMNPLRMRWLKKHAPEAAALERDLTRDAKQRQRKLEAAGVTRKAQRKAEPKQNVVTEKAIDAEALSESLAGFLDGVFAEAGVEAPEDLSERIAALIASLDDGEAPLDADAVAETLADASEELLAEEGADAPQDLQAQIATIIDEEEDMSEQVAARKPDPTKERLEKQTELLEDLLDDLAVLDDLAAEVKALKPLLELKAELADVRKDLRLLKRKLAGGPRAASTDGETEVDAEDGDDADVAEFKRQIKRLKNKGRADGLFADLFENGDAG